MVEKMETYDPAITYPLNQCWVYEIGTYLTDHLQMVDYIYRLEKASDRVRVIKIRDSPLKKRRHVPAGNCITF